MYHLIKKKNRKKLLPYLLLFIIICYYLLEYRLIYGISYSNVYIIYNIAEYVP